MRVTDPHPAVPQPDESRELGEMTAEHRAARQPEGDVFDPRDQMQEPSDQLNRPSDDLIQSEKRVKPCHAPPGETA